MEPAPTTFSTPQSPLHVAVIMDGNGRWARLRGMPRAAGHARGADAVRRSVRAASSLGVSYLTLYGFSAENWKRPATEIDDLMALLRHYLRAEIGELHTREIRLRVIGERTDLPDDIVSMIDYAEELTRDNAAFHLTVALSYGARQEITRSVREIARSVARGDVDEASIDEALVASHLATSDLPDPDLLIRTGGERRLSNFLLWQLAYTELVFLDVLWPEFGHAHFEEAIREFNRRERRYGTTGA